MPVVNQSQPPVIIGSASNVHTATDDALAGTLSKHRLALTVSPDPIMPPLMHEVKSRSRAPDVPGAFDITARSSYNRRR